MPDVTIPSGAGTNLRAYLSLPPGQGPSPGVVVVHEVFGLTTDARMQADRLAAAGYVALVPDLYTRGGMLRCVKATFRAMANGHGQAFADIEAARAWLAARQDTTERTGVIGFCMGGGFALLTASRGFEASSVNYGPLPDDLDAVLAGACPVVASYGGRDRQLGGSAARLEEALSARGIDHDVKEYPGAGHSFLNRHNVGPLEPLMRIAGVGYHQPSAEDAWRRILAFFAAHLQAGSDPAGPRS
jgi:carboxymethylenebutenolidase